MKQKQNDEFLTHGDLAVVKISRKLRETKPGWATKKRKKIAVIIDFFSISIIMGL